jgi:hypothetical protein
MSTVTNRSLIKDFARWLVELAAASRGGGRV